VTRSPLGRAAASTGAGRRALVTGGAGFLGGHMVARLLADGWEVVIVDDLSSGHRDRVPGAARLEVADIATDAVSAIVRDARPDVVFHLAAQASVPRSVADPARDRAVNVDGTARILDGARAAGAGRCVFVSSGGAIYGETRRAASERSRVDPKSPYGRHKLEAEGIVARSGVSYAIARPSNIYGTGQSVGLEGAVVAAFVARALAREPLAIDGDGRQTRDFIHASDVVEALVRLAAPSAPSGIWNVSAGRRTSIAELATIVEREAGVTLGRLERPVRAGDVHDSAVSSTRLRRLGWRPAVSLRHGIRELLGRA
jgi:UDP-glucose 4-epimerase